jgi:hypothetical protein
VKIPPLIAQAREAFRRDLPELMKKRFRQWVAYYGDKRIGFGSSQRQLYQKCLRQGYPNGEFLVDCIIPEMPEEIDIEELLDL